MAAILPRPQQVKSRMKTKRSNKPIAVAASSPGRPLRTICQFPQTTFILVLE